MTEYIKREDALEITKRTSGDYATAFAEIRKISAADVTPVIHGKWEVIHIKNHWDKAWCSACKRVFESYEWGSNYCPVCGAKMDRIEEKINALPTADVVSVVRCKDCKYAYINPSGAILCSSSMQMKKQDGFCDYGDINDGGVDIEID